MTAAEILLLDFDNEISNTRRTLERLPEDNPAWKPHEKSMPIGRLGMHCATMIMFGYNILEEDGMDLAAPKVPHPNLDFTTRDAMLAQLNDGATKCRAALAAASNDHLAAPWNFTWGPQTIFKGPRAQAFRVMFFDHLIHHTAQLGVYLRLLNIPVPALYGPSADEQWSPK